MNPFVSIQQAITKQERVKKRVPSAMEQFKVFIGRGQVKTDIAQNAPETPQAASAPKTGAGEGEAPAEAQGQPSAAPATGGAKTDATQGKVKRQKK